MLKRVFLGVTVFISIALVAVFLSVRHLPAYYNQPTLHVSGDKSARVTATAWAVFSLETGDILFAENETKILPIASVTKLATAAALLDSYDMSYTTTTSWQDIYTEGRAGGLIAGEKLSREELLFPLLLESSNDAAAVLESSLPPGELISSMNNYAVTKGLNSTTFKDVSGLSPENKSSVLDLVRLAHIINQEQPHITDITRLKQFFNPNHGWQNNNPFVAHAGYVGGKHGFTPEAGRTAIAVFEEEFPRNKTAQVGYVLLGSTDLKTDMSALRELVRTSVYYQ